MTRETVEDFLGLEIDYYVTINKSRFAEVIDAMGGVDIYVERDMHYEDPWDDDGGLYIDLKQGLQHLDGKTAIEFFRFRDAEGDVGRVRRQQAFMKACADRLSEPSMLIKIPELLSVAVDAVDTEQFAKLDFANCLPRRTPFCHRQLQCVRLPVYGIIY